MGSQERSAAYKNVLPLNLIALLGCARDDDGAKRCQNSAALSMIMRRTASAPPLNL